MKNIRINSIFAVLALTLLFSGCAKDKNEPSKPTFWPVIEILGDEFVVVKNGETYTDAGATAKVNGVDVPFTTVSDVDDTEYGAYTVTYSAQNEDGVSASQTRTVIVVDTTAADDDLSGSYQRDAGLPMSVWSKDAVRPFTYNSNNPGGVGSNPPFDVPFVAYNVAPGIFVMPLQQAGALSPFYATSGSVGGDPQIPFNVNANVGDVAYSYYMNGPNFGAAARTFVKR